MTLNESWENEVNYDVIIRTPAVQSLLARHASQAKIPVRAEDLVKRGKLVVPAARWFAKKVGIKTEKQCTKTVASPVGKTLVAALCSLARQAISIQTVKQFQDGCLLEAKVPSDWRAAEGDLLITVRQHEDGTLVEAFIHFDQLFDWGKSTHYLEAVFKDLSMALWEVS